jgi:hypothetical protein
MMRTCTTCGTTNALYARECKKCGKSFSGEQQVTAIGGIPAHCDEPGCEQPPAYSPNTRGGGPWFCRLHAWQDPYIPPPAKSLRQVQAEADLFCRSKGLLNVVAMREYCKDRLDRLPIAHREPGCDDDL